MKAEELQIGTLYRMCAGDFGEFSGMGRTGLAIFHPAGEPDMQSCWAISPAEVDREATADEIASNSSRG